MENADVCPTFIETLKTENAGSVPKRLIIQLVCKFLMDQIEIPSFKKWQSDDQSI